MSGDPIRRVSVNSSNSSSSKNSTYLPLLGVEDFKESPVSPAVLKHDLLKTLTLSDDLIQSSSKYDENLLFKVTVIDQFIYSQNYLEEEHFNDRKFSTLQKKMEPEVSEANDMNIKIAMLHHFTYRFLYSVTQPITSDYIKSLGHDPNSAGIILSLGPIAGLFSVFFFAFTSNKSYYLSYLLLSVLYTTAFVCFLLAQPYKSINLIGISRFLVGFASGRIASKRYLSEYSPKSKIGEYSFGYVIIGSIGMALGPTLTLLCSYLPTFTIDIGLELSFDQFTYPGWIAICISLLFGIAVLVKFHDPYRLDFAIFQDSDVREKQEERIVENDKIKEQIDHIQGSQSKNVFSYIKVACLVLFTFLIMSNVFT